MSRPVPPSSPEGGAGRPRGVVTLGELRGRAEQTTQHRGGARGRVGAIPGLSGPPSPRAPGIRRLWRAHHQAVLVGAGVAVVVLAGALLVALGARPADDGGLTARTQLDQAASEQRARVAVGRTLVESGRIESGPPVQDLLIEGRTDPRILATLAGMISGGPVRVRDLPAVPGEDAGQPRHQLLLDLPASKVGLVRGYYSAQQDPYRPSTLAPTPTGLWVAYPPGAPPRLLQGLAGS